MRLSNRILWILILTWFILSFYWFYKYFFELKLTNLHIESNISGFSWSLVNSKFKKDFFCEDKICTINEIPPFDYNLIIKKDNYIDYRQEFNLWKTNDIFIYLEKDIILEKFENINSKLDTEGKVENETYNNIYNDDKYYYNHINDYSWWKLYIHNKNNSNIISIDFNPKIKYIKSIWNKNLVIVSDVWSYNFNLNTMKLEYFSIFSDYIKINDNYIWIINSQDSIRRKNFWFDNIEWNLIVFYDINTKKKYILESSDLEIPKIYLGALWTYIEWSNIYIENDKWEVFIVKWY